MEKKIISIGSKDRKSYNITLPIDWVRDQKLHESRKADLEIVGNCVVIRAFEKAPTSVTLDANVLKNSIERVIQILYMNGIDEIKITNADSKLINAISSVIEQRCMGFGIIEQNNGCKIKDLSTPKDNFDANLDRCFHVLLQISEEKDEETLKIHDKILNMLTTYCQRLLAKQGHEKYKDIANYSRLCSEIEHIGDEYIRARNKKEKISYSCIKLFKGMYDLYFKFSDSKFDELQKSIKQLSKNGGSYYDSVIICRINTALGLIYALKGFKEEYTLLR